MRIDGSTAYVRLFPKLPDGYNYHVELDEGIFVGNIGTGCEVNVNMLSKKNKWNFTTIDVTPPFVFLFSDPALIRDENFLVRVFTQEAITLQCTLVNSDNGRSQPVECVPFKNKEERFPTRFEWSPSFNLTDVHYEFVVIATDRSNNSATSKIELTIDRVPPVPTL